MNRRPELDLARTVAILMMVIYHVAYDLDVFYGWDVPALSRPWLMFAHMTAILFLLISGISSALSLSRGTDWTKQLRRFAIVGGAAALVSAVTYVALGGMYVRFGILHCIAVAGLLLPFVTRLKSWTILLGIAVIAAGFYTISIRMDTSWLLPFGIRPKPFGTVDYFPLLPWFGVILIGYGLGCWALTIERRFPRRTQRENAALNKHGKMMQSLGLPGRHSLLIYLVHQPLIMFILWLTMGSPHQ